MVKYLDNTEDECSSQARAFSKSLITWGAGLLLALSVVGYPLVSAFPVLLDINSRFVSIPFRALILLLSLIFLALGVRHKFRISA